MSTYNGEAFLREQLDSLLGQIGVSVQVLVRDDGSSDKTMEILSEYKNLGYIEVIQGSNIGWRKSFMELVYSAPDSDYYAFCDQDDIWLPEKLSVAVEQLEHNSDSTPSLYGSNLYYYQSGEIKGKLNLNSNYTKQSSLIRTLTAGCTLVFNKQLKDLMSQRRPSYIEAHDSWTFLVALFLGKVIYDDNAYIKYRQHDNNQIGAKRTFLEKLGRRIDTLKKTGKDHGKSDCAKEFLAQFHDMLSDEDRTIVEKVAYYRDSLSKRLALLLDNRYTTGKLSNDVILKLKILTSTL